MAKGAERPAGIASHRLTERYVLEVLETVKRNYNVDERNVFLMGFSQGASQAFSIGLKHPEVFRGIIPIGGWCDDAEHPPARLARAREHGLVLICHSPDDRRVEWEACEKATAFLKTAGVAHAVLRYPGGHRIPTELTRAIAAWIAKPGPTAPELPASPEK
jgi:phospholipase/carboxylesterase